MTQNDSKLEQASAATVKSATRVLEIFEYFDEVRRPVTIQDVAQALGYPHSSSAALLKSLASLGYLEYNEQKKSFFPSVRISLLGNWVEAEALPIRNVQRLMRLLSEETGCTIILAIRVGLHAQYVKVIQGTTSIRFHVKPSTKRLLPFSTLGRVLLAELPPPEAKKLVAEAVAASPDEGATAREVGEELKKIRKRGLALYADLVTPGATMLAMPIRTKHAARPVALGIAAPKEYFRENKQRFTELMKRAIAEHISSERHESRWPDDELSGEDSIRS